MVCTTLVETSADSSALLTVHQTPECSLSAAHPAHTTPGTGSASPAPAVQWHNRVHTTHECVTIDRNMSAERLCAAPESPPDRPAIIPCSMLRRHAGDMPCAAGTHRGLWAEEKLALCIFTKSQTRS
mmetsp:Transcript_475/g.1219  ORF Transcript_475/g.1219 Transcript_475/m.1219 type:complete len:127 (-) Transcript_475:1648-2028(-)